MSSIETDHKKDKNNSTNIAYMDKNGYFYIRKGNRVKFTGQFEANDRMMAEADLQEIIEHGIIRDTDRLSDFIRKYSRPEGVDGSNVGNNEAGRAGNDRLGIVDMEQEANIRPDGERVVSGVYESKEPRFKE